MFPRNSFLNIFVLFLNFYKNFKFWRCGSLVEARVLHFQFNTRKIIQLKLNNRHFWADGYLWSFHSPDSLLLAHNKQLMLTAKLLKCKKIPLPSFCRRKNKKDEIKVGTAEIDSSSLEFLTDAIVLTNSHQIDSVISTTRNSTVKKLHFRIQARTNSKWNFESKCILFSKMMFSKLFYSNSFDLITIFSFQFNLPQRGQFDEGQWCPF